MQRNSRGRFVSDYLPYSSVSTKQNPEYKRALDKVGKANKKYPGRITVHEVLRLIKESNFICFWCGKKDLSGRDLTLDHVKPINDTRHLVISCLGCNARRGNANRSIRVLTAEEKKERWIANMGKRAFYMRNWYALNREKWNSYQRMYRRKEME